MWIWYLFLSTLHANEREFTEFAQFWQISSQLLPNAPLTWEKLGGENETPLPHPTLMPSSMSVGATWSLRSTTNLANCLTLMMYLGSSESALMIFVHLSERWIEDETWWMCQLCWKIHVLRVDLLSYSARRSIQAEYTKTVKRWCKHDTLTQLHLRFMANLLYLATCRGCSLCRVCLSAARSQSAGGARPVSDSLMPLGTNAKPSNQSVLLWQNLFLLIQWMDYVNQKPELKLKVICGVNTYL